MTRSGHGQAEQRVERIQIHRALCIRLQKDRDFFREVAAVQSLQRIERLFVRALVLLRVGMKNRAAADRDCRRELADDKCIAVKAEHGRIQPELRVCGFARIQRVLADQRYAGEHLNRSLMKPNLDQVFQRLRAGQQKQVHVQYLGGPEYMRDGEDHSALHLRQVDALKIYRGSLPGDGLACHVAVHLKAADLCFEPARDEFYFLILPDLAGGQGPGYHGPKTTDAERTVNGQAEHVIGGARANCQRQVMDCFFQLVHSLACLRAYRDNLRAFEE